MKVIEEIKRIIHLSDLHIGESYKGKEIFRRDIGDQLVEEVNEIKPDIIVISGDITADGYEHEYKMAREFLSRFKVPKMIDTEENNIGLKELDQFDSPIFSVPGNHDTRHGSFDLKLKFLRELVDTYKEYDVKTRELSGKEQNKFFIKRFKPLIIDFFNSCGGLTAFEKYIGKAQKIYNGKGFYLVGVNSSGVGKDMDADGDVDFDDVKMARSLGLVGVKTLPWIEKSVKKADPDDFIIVVMHHHLIGIPDTGNDDNVLMDSGDILRLLLSCGVDLVLNGHKHNPWLWNLNGLPVLDGGSCASSSTPCDNNFNLIEIEEEIVIKRRYLGKHKRWEEVARFKNKKFKRRKRNL